VALGAGRDAADVAVYNQFGPAVFPHTQRISVELLYEKIILFSDNPLVERSR
jgi:hypothetical protein